ncbi:MAG: mercury(II) reductase [Desulfobacteria bacterium]|jgi:mercuric reductase
MKKFDLVIIGGGAGGFAAAIRANELKAKTALINEGLPLGGTCVNVGCVPSKRLLWAAEVMHSANNHKIPGIELRVEKFDFQEVIQDERSLVSRLREEKYERVLRGLNSVTLVEGRAKFVSAKEVEVNGERITADRFIIATGSTASAPQIEGIEGVRYVTHIGALKLEKLPEKLLILGAGPVGIEFAQMYARFGSEVTIIKRSPGILRFAEKELTGRLAEILEKDGVRIISSAQIKSAHRTNGQKVLLVSSDGKVVEVAGDEILLATGKTPNTKGLGLKAAGFEVNEKEAIIVNHFLQTSQEHIYAVGDVASLPARYETTAGREGTLAAQNALTGSWEGIDYNAVPFTIFSDPQLAGVGFTEERQMKEMGVCSCKTISFDIVPKAIITNRTEGFIKMVAHPETGQIMGVHILAPNAGEIIAEAMMLVKNKNTIDDVANSLPMFPTMSEAIKIVALSFTKDVSKLSCCV